VNLTKTTDQFSHEIFGKLTTIINEENDAYFLSSEVSSILGYGENRELLKRLEDDEKISLTNAESVVLLKHNDINSRGIQLLTESGLYSAILGSKKPEAKVFKKWVTSKVLPAIRKTGNYFAVTTKYSMPATHLEAAKAWIAALEKNEVLQHQLEIAAPKIEIYDMAMESNDALSMNDAAKVLKLGYGRNTLFAKLRNAGILMSNNRPYQKYINNGWFRVIERPGNFSNTRSEIRVITLVLQKGLTEIVNAVK
jgi:prophage antirepressor-like protein